MRPPDAEAHADHEHGGTESTQADDRLAELCQAGTGIACLYGFFHDMYRRQSQDGDRFQKFKFSKTSEWLFACCGLCLHIALSVAHDVPDDFADANRQLMFGHTAFYSKRIV